VQIHIPPKGKNRERIYNQDEIDRIVSALGYTPGETPRNKRAQVGAALLLAVETAMPSGELMGLKWCDVDLDFHVAHLKDTKNGDRRDVPL
jgi:integrase